MKNIFLKIIQGSAQDFIQNKPKNIYLKLILLIFIFSGIYGVTIGIWRAPLQGFYMLIKFPLLIILMILTTSIANWIISLTLGLKISFRNYFLLIFTTYSLASIMLASFSSILLLFLYNTPQVGSKNENVGVAVVILFQVTFITIAGILSHLKLYRYIKEVTNKNLATKLTIIWLGLNLFIGSQLSWVLRPFIGNAASEIQFLRDRPLEGNFYEGLYNSIVNILKK